MRIASARRYRMRTCIINCTTHAQMCNWAPNFGSMRRLVEGPVCVSAGHVPDVVFYVSSGETKRWKHHSRHTLSTSRYALIGSTFWRHIVKFTTPLRHSRGKSNTLNSHTKTEIVLSLVFEQGLSLIEFMNPTAIVTAWVLLLGLKFNISQPCSFKRWDNCEWWIVMWDLRFSQRWKCQL